MRSTDPDAARAFYQALFGYGVDPLPMAGPDHTTFALPGEQAPLGGMGAPPGTPAHWVVYFGVADATAAADDSGGLVLAAPFSTPYGRLAGLADPAGAASWVVESDGSGQPETSG